MLAACAVLLISHSTSASSASALKQLVARAEETHSAAVLVIRDHKTVAEHRDSVGNGRIDLRSATKAVVALGVGVLLREGRLESLDTPVYRFYPEWNQGRKRRVTIRMLLNQTSGLRDDQDSAAADSDRVRFALASELQSDPGTTFAESDSGADLLMGILGKAAGAAADEFVERDLFAPLGIRDASWQNDGAGNILGSSGLTLTADDAANIGLLVLDAGHRNGEQLVAASFIDEVLNPPASASVEHGLLWTRAPAWIRLSVDATTLELIRKLDVPEDIVRKISRLEGRSFDGSESLVAALHKVLTEFEFDAFYANAQAHSIRMGTLFHLELGPMAAFAASGEGNHIVVVPAARLVAVRLTSAPDDQYEDFVERVLDVAKVWNPSLKAH